MIFQPIDPTQETYRHLRQKSRLSNWMGLIGGQMIRRQADEQMRNVEAEGRMARRQLYGETQAAGDDMGDTYLGDVQITHQQPQPQPQGSGILVPILCAALGTLGPAGAVGGYLLSRWAAQVPAQQTAAPATPERITETIRETFTIDLGKIPAK